MSNVHDMEEWLERKRDAETLHKGGGGGISGGMSEDSLKPRVDFLHTAFLWLAGAIITVALAIVTVTFTMSNSTNGRIDKLTDAVSTMNREAGEQSTKQDDTNRRLDRIESKIDQLLERKGK
ncbi:hypothetical protein VHN57_08400 [Sphingobium sp. WW5]|uniref:hypothetical protein n=1 Tax=unclassified Sphingobium TaxID=2611147 RepID=UPI003C1604A7